MFSSVGQESQSTGSRFACLCDVVEMDCRVSDLVQVVLIGVIGSENCTSVVVGYLCSIFCTESLQFVHVQAGGVGCVDVPRAVERPHCVLSGLEGSIFKFACKRQKYLQSTEIR